MSGVKYTVSSTDMWSKQGGEIVRSTFVLTVANAVSSGLHLVRNLFIVRLLPPNEYGLWSLVSTLMHYANYADVGINTGVLLHVPKLVGQKEEQRAEYVQRHGFAAIVGVTGIIGAGMVLAAYSPLLIGTPWSMMITITGAAVLTYGFLNYYNVAIRIRGNYLLIGASTISVALAALVAILYPMMKRAGYPEGSSMGLLASGGIIAPVIPPSLPLILIGVAGNISIKNLFLGGIAPGIMMGATLMLVWAWLMRKENLVVMERASGIERLAAFRDARNAQLELRFEKMGHVREAEKRKVANLYEQYKTWIRDTLETEDQPSIRVAAIFTGKGGR